LHEGRPRERRQPAQVSDLEGLDEDGGVCAIEAVAAEGREEGLLQRESEVLEVGRVLRLRIDADGPFRGVRRRPSEVEDLLERRNFEAAVE
jgi:hypothetical protein